MKDEVKKEGWCPSVCPITHRPFFMWIEHPSEGIVPTYGGPFDSYTIPEPEIEGDFDDFHKIEYLCYRYDHDAGYWVDGCENPGIRVIDDQVLFNYISDLAPSANQTKR